MIISVLILIRKIKIIILHLDENHQSNYLYIVFKRQLIFFLIKILTILLTIMYSPNIVWAWYIQKYTANLGWIPAFFYMRDLVLGTILSFIHILTMHPPVFIAKDSQVCIVSYFWTKNFANYPNVIDLHCLHSSAYTLKFLWFYF